MYESERAAREESKKKDEFLAVLGHELRGPLNAIQIGADTVKLEAERNAGHLLETGRMLSRHSRILNVLVSDLLDIARVNQGKIRLKRGNVDIRQCVHQAVEAHAAAVIRKQQTLDVAMPGTEVIAHVDDVRVTEMISNLVSNASRHSPPGTRIHVSVDCAGNEVAITVKDEGVGIDPAQLDVIFQPMTSGASADTMEGLGIGLWLTRQLAELHGGAVAVHSEGIGKGATFRISLPTGG